MSVILIADDEARIRRLVSDFLKQDGHTILEAGDGQEALAIIQEAHPPVELAILDVMMPKMDGFALLHTLRAEEATQALPVMMLTARAEDGDQVLGLEGGADGGNSGAAVHGARRDDGDAVTKLKGEMDRWTAK